MRRSGRWLRRHRQSQKAVARSDCFGLAYASDGRSGGCAGVEKTVPANPADDADLLSQQRCGTRSEGFRRVRGFLKTGGHAEPDLACSRRTDGFLVDTAPKRKVNTEPALEMEFV